VPTQRELLWAIGPSIWDTFPALLQSEDKELITRAVALYRERFNRVGLAENFVFDGMRETLTELGKHYALYVATSKPTPGALLVLNHFQLTPFFRAIHGSDPDGTVRQKADVIARCLRTEGLKPEECFMIGDRKYDVIGARANGLRVALVDFGFASPEEIAEFRADALFSTVAELRAYFVKLAA
jgi:phosphoglycolate phosphatase